MWREDVTVLEQQVGQTGSVRDFGAVFVAEGGVERRVPWMSLPEVVDELGQPVRSFPSYRGQRNFPGWYWSATMGCRIGFESWVERDHLVALDFDVSVVTIVSQPFWLLWPHGSKQRRHAPDFLVSSADGGMLVLDSRPVELIGDTDRDAFEVTGRACAELGWRYAVWDRLDGVVVANQKWLAGYRHPRCFVEPLAILLLELFEQPRTLLDGAELAGDPLGTLPVLYHLLWKQVLVADLSVALSHRTLVCCSPQLANVANQANEWIATGARA